MSEYDFEIKEVKLDCGANIKVIGVGGCGSNMVNHIIEGSQYTSSIELVVANTDIQDLNKSKSEVKLQLGAKLTGGRGAGAKPEVGLESAQEAEEEIKNCLSGSNLIFLATGLGGGTGTGAAPYIARLAKEMGILVIGIATMPFSYERRDKKAKKGLEEFKKECDSVILVHNEQLSELAGDDAGVEESFRLVDNILLDAVESMLSILLNTGDANVDFADVKTIMTYRGLAQIGSGSGKGENAVSDAFSEAFNSPLLDSAGQDHGSAKGFLAFVSYGKGVTYKSLNRAMVEHSSEFDEDIEYIYGHMCDTNLEDDEAHVIVMITGFEDDSSGVVEQTQQVSEPIKVFKHDEFQLLRTGTGDTHMSIEDYKAIDYSTPAYRRNQQD